MHNICHFCLMHFCFNIFYIQFSYFLYNCIFVYSLHMHNPRSTHDSWLSKFVQCTYAICSESISINYVIHTMIYWLWSSKPLSPIKYLIQSQSDEMDWVAGGQYYILLKYPSWQNSVKYQIKIHQQQQHVNDSLPLWQ